MSADLEMEPALSRLMERFGIAATARASLSLYNTREDLDALAAAIRKTLEFFG